MVRSIEASVDRLGPNDAGRQEPELKSGECSIVVFSWISAFEQPTMVVSEGHCISCRKTFRADIFGRGFIRLRQNLSFVIIPLKIGCIGVEM